jgi:hypothetical protein
MRRMQDSNFRQVVRLTSLLMRMKRHERQMEAFESTAVCHDVLEKKGLAVDSENFSKLYFIELKRVSLF